MMARLRRPLPEGSWETPEWMLPFGGSSVAESSFQIPTSFWLKMRNQAGFPNIQPPKTCYLLT